jgi:hypothetical protein
VIQCGIINYPFLDARDSYLADLRVDTGFELLVAHLKAGGRAGGMQREIRKVVAVR